MNVITNNHKYEILSFCDLEEKYQRKARKEFDWIKDIEDSYGYFVYKKEVYNLRDFFRSYQTLKDEKTSREFYAHGVYSWGYFNGLAVKFVDNNEAVKIAYYYSQMKFQEDLR